jgi:hypothetical protein
MEAPLRAGLDVRLLGTTVAVDHLCGDPAAVALLQSLMVGEGDDALLASEVSLRTVGRRATSRAPALEDVFTVSTGCP